VLDASTDGRPVPSRLNTVLSVQDPSFRRPRSVGSRVASPELSRRMRAFPAARFPSRADRLLAREGDLSPRTGAPTSATTPRSLGRKVNVVA
jgi:hypothetical protein